MTVERFLQTTQRYGVGIGAVLVVLCAMAGFFQPAVFFEGYLSAFIFWVQIALGCLAVLLLQYLTSGLWGAAITRLLEAGATTLPFCAALFLPILFGLPYLFPWIHPVDPGLRHLVAQKEAYLNVPFYLIRYVVYFLVLGGLAAWYQALSLRRGAGDLSTLAKWSGPALIVFVLLMNFATIDWVMSLKPEWYSSMLVVEFVAEEAVVTLAWSILALRVLDRAGMMGGAITGKVSHDLGNLLLGFTCFWTYVTFAEYLIIWTGNLPHEVSWFADRSSAGWKTVAVLLVFVHFVIPLFCLILTSVSRNLGRLAWVAGLMIVAHYVQIVWWIGPAFGPHSCLPWTSPVLVVAIGMIWFAVYARRLLAAPLFIPGLELREKAGVIV